MKPRVAAPRGYPGTEAERWRQPQAGLRLICKHRGAQQRHNPIGVVVSSDFIPQGSREARQPWAVRRNRFAVKTSRVKCLLAFLEFWNMPTLISNATTIEAAGNKPKLIEEFVGRVNSETTAVSVARMKSPGGWIEPGQTPEFDEYTIVLRGLLRVKTNDGEIDVGAGQAVIVHHGEWVQYSSPEPDGAEYIAVCVPAFSMETVHRDE
jgi:ethanolamine utilization protein EutQ